LSHSTSFRHTLSCVCLWLVFRANPAGPPLATYCGAAGAPLALSGAARVPVCQRGVHTPIAACGASLLKGQLVELQTHQPLKNATAHGQAGKRHTGNNTAAPPAPAAGSPAPGSPPRSRRRNVAAAIQSSVCGTKKALSFSGCFGTGEYGERFQSLLITKMPDFQY
jgi:hypothetical protein